MLAGHKPPGPNRCSPDNATLTPSVATEEERNRPQDLEIVLPDVVTIGDENRSETAADTPAVTTGRWMTFL
jgi:hypothetical protein